MPNNFLNAIAVILTIPVIFSCEKNEVEEIQLDDHIVVLQQTHGPKLGYSSISGVSILDDKGVKFKDLNKNGQSDEQSFATGDPVLAPDF